MCWIAAPAAPASGSGAAVAASLAAAALGTETNGSLVCPGSLNGIVALKPTVGLVSRTHIVPISHSQDTPGPMTRSVADAAILLTAMAGSDAADPATAPADSRRTDYAAALGISLKGKRLGLIATPGNAPTDAVFAAALDKMRAAGAQIVLIRKFPKSDFSSQEELVLQTELKADMASYLASLPGAGPKTLADLIAFNAKSPRELVLFGQDYFQKADTTKGLADPAYKKALTVMQKEGPQHPGSRHHRGKAGCDHPCPPTIPPSGWTWSRVTMTAARRRACRRWRVILI